MIGVAIALVRRDERRVARHDAEQHLDEMRLGRGNAAVCEAQPHDARAVRGKPFESGPKLAGAASGQVVKLGPRVLTVRHEHDSDLIAELGADVNQAARAQCFVVRMRGGNDQRSSLRHPGRQPRERRRPQGLVGARFCGIEGSVHVCRRPYTLSRSRAPLRPHAACPPV